MEQALKNAEDVEITEDTEITEDAEFLFGVSASSVRLDAISAADPDDEYAEGPAVAVEFQGLHAKKAPFPWWMIIAMAAAILIGYGVAWLVFSVLE